MDIKKKFLIIRLSALGDIIHALPVVCAIKEKYKDAQIDWVVGDKFKYLVEGNPYINRVYVANLSKWKKNWLSLKTIKEIIELDKEIQKEKYDYSIDCHGMFKSLVIQAFSGARKRVGYKDYREFATLGCNVLVKPKSKRPHRNYHVIRRNLDLLVGCGILTEDELKDYKPKAVLPVTNEEVKKKVDEMLEDVDKTKKLAVFAPATTWDNKHWAKENWRELYFGLKDKVNVVFTGVEGDLKLIGEITNGDKDARILAGKTNILEYIEVIKRADIVVSPDSSAAHIAWALSVKNIFTMFCATSANAFGPLGATLYPKGEPVCVPCHKRKCKDPICTRQTTACEVLADIEKIIFEGNKAIGQ